MKKVFLIIGIGILFACVLFFGSKWYDKKFTEDQVDAYLQQYDYAQDVHSKETNYDSKTGRYYVRIIYKNYPNRTYEYSFRSSKMLGIAYENDVSVQTSEYLEGL